MGLKVLFESTLGAERVPASLRLAQAAPPALPDFIFGGLPVLCNHRQTRYSL